MRSLSLVALSVCLGCAGAQSSPAVLDPASAAEAALQAYDSNQDGEIGGDELDECAALRASLRRLDANKNRALEADEIASRLSAYSSPPKLIRPELFVTRRNLELKDAKVVLEPESFMGAGRQAYQGSSGSGGSVALVGVEDKSDHLNPGFYRVRITTPEGQETINGCELAHDLPYIYRLTFDVR